MLTHLEIHHLVVVEHAVLSLGPGMIIITGETGSGKSVLITALQLILGTKAETALIQPGAPAARIVAHLDITRALLAQEWLRSEGLPIESPCIIQRTIVREGRARILLNGQSISLPQLRRFSDFFIQLHGQHAHQTLLRAHEQRRLLDEFAQNQPERHAVESAYRHWLHHVERRESLQAHRSNVGDLALLQYQVKELNDLQLGPDEWEQLHQEHTALTQSAEHQEAHSKLYQLLIDTPIASGLHLASNLGDMTLHTLLSQALVHTEEALHHLRQNPPMLENPARLATIDSRLSTIYDMARKHRVSPEHLPQYHQTLTQRFTESADWDAGLQQVDLDIASALTSYHIAAQQLSVTRENASVQLGKAIALRMEVLGFTEARCEIRLTATESHTPSPTGKESIEYWVSTNPDYPLQPLTKVVSGGELSRISLAIQMITADSLRTPTLIFDEVDTGIGGKTGAIIGKTLQDLSKHAQIICVTHLPQVAALADTHIVVEKARKEGRTITQIRILETPLRVEELARMLGGVTPQARAHARALIDENL